ncbi:MAG: class I SAM-dependent methyltransferase [Solirubrobacterales bacterium]|nr:class I SAM-dependent methyltransferase [Solirubrobacterales bacterium]
MGTDEISDIRRFAFGRNWARFVSEVDDERIREAESSLREMLERDDLSGMTFLDVGSGSGLFSLAAGRLGAARVHSFDFDPESVGATRALRRTYAPAAEQWTVERGSILDVEYVERLGQWDVVYSWGVLHHTGDMERALESAGRLVAPGGLLFIAIYNDQGWRSRVWWHAKRLCVTLPASLQPLYAALVYLPFEAKAILGSLLRLQPQRYWRRRVAYSRQGRGMSHWHDVLDWVGGYPFEVAAPERIFDFYKRRGFVLVRLVTKGGSLGCNEYVFKRVALTPSREPQPVAETAPHVLVEPDR